MKPLLIALMSLSALVSSNTWSAQLRPITHHYFSCWGEATFSGVDGESTRNIYLNSSPIPGQIAEDPDEIVAFGLNHDYQAENGYPTLRKWDIKPVNVGKDLLFKYGNSINLVVHASQKAGRIVYTGKYKYVFSNKEKSTLTAVKIHCEKNEF